MVHRSFAVVLVALMLLSVIPVGGVAAETSTDVAVAVHSAGIDAQVTDRFRSRAPAAGLARTDTEGVLEQPTRSDIYDAVRVTPGVDLAALAATVGVAKSTVRYHVDVLRDVGLVETVEIAGTLRVSTAETDAELAGILRSDSVGGVLTAVAEEEPATVTSIAHATDRAPSTVSHHLAALEAGEYVDRERHGESVVTTLTPETRHAIASAPNGGAADD